jgi:hypothetical protein
MRAEGAPARFGRGFAAYFVFREMGGPGSPGLHLHPTDEDLSVGAPDLGLSSDACYAGWMVGPGRGFAACFVFRNWAIWNSWG